MITKVKNLPLVTHFADCVPLFFYDPVQQVVATSHSGWRGTVGKIGKVTVERMQEAFGCKPEDILCGIGPSICKHCYESRRVTQLRSIESIMNLSRRIGKALLICL